MVWGAHIAGMPIEETALSFAPIIAATGGIAGVKMWARLAKRQAAPSRRRGKAGGQR
jgi:hypothetical protein